MNNIKNNITKFDGRTFKVNQSTGEATEMISLLVPIGTTYRTPEQQAAYRARQALQEEYNQKEQYKQLVRSELGNFYFILTNNIFSDVTPQTATKLIMLCTYLNYSNQFMKTLKTPMVKSDIKKILKLSKSATYDFWNDVKDKYITERDRGLYITESANIFRHNIPDENRYIQYQKLYITAIRNLYAATDIRKHRQLGYIFKLLPYINLEFNIFCKDAFVKEIDEIQPLTITDFCNLIDYDVTQSVRLLKELQSIKFKHKGNEEYLLSYVDNGNTTSQYKMIFINPHIIYNGSDYRRVEILGEFCKTK